MAPKIKQFYFYSNEESRMHIHYKRDGKKAKFWLIPAIELAKNNGFSKHELNKIEEQLKEVQNECIKKWEKHFQS